jgi:outer membrane receptor for ferrienterochelin and colicins
VDDAITRGVEATLTAPLNEKLSLTSSYTYTYSKQKSGEYAGNPLNQMPEHMFNLGLDWKPTDKLNGWMKVTYRGKESDPTQGISSSTTMAPSATYVDLGGSYDVNKNVTVYAGIYNIFDKQVRYDDYGYVEDGRRYWLGMNVKF